MKTRVRARIVGRVQGVGFRPTVYRYATQLGLSGYVCNGPQGVTLEVEGDDLNVGLFFHRLAGTPPPQAAIENIEKQQLTTAGYQRFEVVESEAAGPATAHLAPDLALCDDCRRELLDPRDRRHGYAFTNCTNCGPRFTIIRDLPYDRAHTSMAGFTMCAPCEHEYHDPRDRRFHAQPNGCPDCGPQLNRPVAEAVRVLRAGRIVALKSLGGFHFACDAFNNAAIARLRQRKHRPGKSFAVMFRDLATLKQHCIVSEAEEAELLSPAAPIVIVGARSTIASTISPDTRTVGAFLPYTPLHHLLLAEFPALVMTSGNLTEEPIASDETELPAVADAVLTHNRAIVHKCDDSVLRVVNGQRQFFRRARGFVPNAIRIATDSPEILAVGGELKNTFCLLRAGNAFLSQHIGDLKDHRTYQYFSHEIAEWRRLMQVKPVAVAHDLHPSYLSTRYATETGLRTIGVQHHHAHIASVMAEHDLHEPVIGLALDGTGYGTDGTIWGGEVLVADRAEFERVAHFKPYALPGGDRAIREPWRMAASVLAAEGLSEPTKRSNPVLKMIAARFNAPLTSSAGRLFDAVAAILGLCEVAEYEAQAAIRLETVADPQVTGRYDSDDLDFGPAIRALVAEKAAGVPVSVIAAKFHNTVAAALVDACRQVRESRQINTVALSGGVFQNELLLRRVVAGLQQDDFKVYANTRVPPNDGGLAFGQAAVAAERMARSCA